MRDGVKLFVSVYIPKDVFSEGRTYPIVMTRTPYSVGPYGADHYRTPRAFRSSRARNSSSSMRTSAAAT